MQVSITKKNADASIKNMETQVGKISKQLADPQGGTFTKNTQTNPKEHCKAITTISWGVIEAEVGENIKKERGMVEKQEGEIKESEDEVEE